MIQLKRRIKKLRGSLTLEASLVLPVFLFCIIAFIYFLQVIIIHDNLQEAITNIGLEAAKYGYVYEDFSDSNSDNQSNQDTSPSNNKNTEGTVDGLVLKMVARSIDSAFFKYGLHDYIDTKVLNKSCVKDGFSGINTYLSSYMEKDNEVDIVLNYQIEIPLIFIKVDNFQVVQRVHLKGWNGYRPIAKYKNSDENTDEEIVFIAETGRVYHLSKDCTHLRLSIKQILLDQVEKLRNSSGGKYKECKICVLPSKDNGNIVFITTTGDRYHWNKNCSGLKRTISEIPISQVGNKTPCKRCGN